MSFFLKNCERLHNYIADIINNIIWNNTASTGDDLYINNDGDGDYFTSTVNLYNNDFDQSASGTYIQIPFPIDSSNLDNEDPVFVVVPSNPPEVTFTDYHLTGLSPCIDEGRLAGAPADDMDEDPRPQGDGVDIGADEYVGVTVIELPSFSTTPANHGVLLEWTTESEIDNTGFNIYRAVSEGVEYEQINDSLIPAEGSPTEGASYQFADINVKNRETYYYKLEDIDLNGLSTVHGPVSATPRLIYGILGR